MYGAQHLKQIGFDARTVAELDIMAHWADATKGATAGQDDAWRKLVIFPPHRFGAVPVSDYRLPSTALPGLPEVGGVMMTAEVVKDEPADTSELFGGGAKEKPAARTWQEGLFSPFLLFCALAPEI